MVTLANQHSPSHRSACLVPSVSHLSSVWGLFSWVTSFHTAVNVQMPTLVVKDSYLARLLPFEVLETGHTKLYQLIQKFLENEVRLSMGRRAQDGFQRRWDKSKPLKPSRESLALS